METFPVRRAIERLRNGMFDPLSVHHLTMKEEMLIKDFSFGLQLLEKGSASPLSICGSYGQGKSHSLAYLHKLALSQGYAVSTVQVDIREIAFHQFSTIYQVLMKNLALPDGKTFMQAWKEYNTPDSLHDVNDLPHRFAMILKALLLPNKKSLKKSLLKPKDFSDWLTKALLGQDLPLSQLKQIFQAKGISEYNEKPLQCKGFDSFALALESIGKLLSLMGYKGLVLFFDEMESIAQGRLTGRIKSYETLEFFFHRKSFVYPVFAFTDDFFHKLQQENYDSEKFSCNYAQAWEERPIIRLQGTSAQGWKKLQNELIYLYSQAYRINLATQTPDLEAILQKVLDKVQAQETRLKLKALVNRLDIETQQLLLH